LTNSRRGFRDGDFDGDLSNITLVCSLDRDFERDRDVNGDLSNVALTCSLDRDFESGNLDGDFDGDLSNITLACSLDRDFGERDSASDCKLDCDLDRVVGASPEEGL